MSSVESNVGSGGSSATLNQKELALANGLDLLRVELPHFSLYAAYYQGTFLYTTFAEQYDDPTHWAARSDKEQEAMRVLAMDEWQDYVRTAGNAVIATY